MLFENSVVREQSSGALLLQIWLEVNILRGRGVISNLNCFALNSVLNKRGLLVVVQLDLIEGGLI